MHQETVQLLQRFHGALSVAGLESDAVVVNQHSLALVEQAGAFTELMHDSLALMHLVWEVRDVFGIRDCCPRSPFSDAEASAECRGERVKEAGAFAAMAIAGLAIAGMAIAGR